MIQKTTVNGEELFLRGGTHTGRNISIEHHYSVRACMSDGYNKWMSGDHFLDWQGGEPGQGIYYTSSSKPLPALGTPMYWTSNNPHNDNYHYANDFGDHYWIVYIEMDCSSLDTDSQGDPWFQLKGILADHNTWPSFQWEQIGNTQGTCGGTAGGLHPFGYILNHAAKCGKFNVFTWGQTGCTINEIPQRPVYYRCFC